MEPRPSHYHSNIEPLPSASLHDMVPRPSPSHDDIETLSSSSPSTREPLPSVSSSVLKPSPTFCLEEQRRPTLIYLPRELIRQVFSLLDREELETIAQALPELAEVANDRRLLRRFILHPEETERKTLHQVIGGYVNVSHLTVLGGFRLTKSFCQRIAKDLTGLKHLCLHFSTPTTAKTIDQELLNVTTRLTQLTFLELHFLDQCYTKDGLLNALSKLNGLSAFHLTQSTAGTSTNHFETRQPVENFEGGRIDLNEIAAQIASRPNASLKDVKIDYKSYRDVRRCSHVGLRALTDHWRTLTSLRLKHLEFNPKRVLSKRPSEVISSLTRLKNLKHLGLTCVEGFSAEEWVDLFLVAAERNTPDQMKNHSTGLNAGTASKRRKDQDENMPSWFDSGPAKMRQVDPNKRPSSGFDSSSAQRAFPKLETLELDFIPDVFLRHLGLVYGESLKSLSLFEYTRLFDASEEGNTNCPKEFSEILRSFSALSKFFLGIKSSSFDPRVRRLLRWFLNDQLDPLPFSIEIAKL